MLSSLLKSYSIHISLSSGALLGATPVGVKLPAGEILVRRTGEKPGRNGPHASTCSHREDLLGTQSPLPIKPRLSLSVCSLAVPFLSLFRLKYRTSCLPFHEKNWLFFFEIPSLPSHYGMESRFILTLPIIKLAQSLLQIF